MLEATLLRENMKHPFCRRQACNMASNQVASAGAPGAPQPKKRGNGLKGNFDLGISNNMRSAVSPKSSGEGWHLEKT